MRLSPFTLLPIFSFTTASAHLVKRCSPVMDPDLPHGYLPPAPCWQTFDTACKPYLSPDTEMTLDAAHRLAVVYGISDSCRDEIVEELARTADGRKNYGWVEKEGQLTVIEGDGGEGKGGERILVISGMGEAAVGRYAALEYLNY